MKNSKTVYSLASIVLFGLACTVFSDNRDRYHQPEKVMDVAGVRPGMTIGEVGAGRGYFTFKLSSRVGEAGKIYANDIVEDVLSSVRNRYEREGITNIETIRGEIEDPLFPKGELDMVFIVNAFHDLAKPATLLNSLIPSLKPDATVVIVDRDPTKYNDRYGHFLTEQEVVERIEESDLELERIETFLPQHNIYIVRHGENVQGDYLGQKPPGTTPEIFAPGIISTDETELNSVFTPDGTEFYYSIRRDEKYTILFMQQEEGGWTEPRVAPFSTSYSNVDMCISHDGKKMFFGSNRPLSGRGDPEPGHDIWVVEREGTTWGKPRNVDPGVNSGEHQIYPTVTKDGTLYFQSRREGNIGGTDIYRAKFVNGRYLEPENLGDAINTEANEGDVLIAPDESFLIVTARRSDSLGKADLYISFRRSDGTWTTAENMGKTVNSEETEYCPMLSPDGKYLFFTSTRTGNGDIYWVDARIIDELRR